jgi:L-alanine-DL-glutamate epimerase-like enolase superfamily enzyme
VKITSIETFILHVPVTRQGIADSTHRLTHWGTPSVIIRTDESISGFGYTGTHAHLPTDRLITQFVGESYAPLLIGSDPLEVRSLWSKLLHHAPLQWVGRAGISHLALSAIDIALWDLKAKAAQMPLWKLLGGSGEKKICAYNTDGGWLNWSIDQLVGDAKSLLDCGYRGIKMKVGTGHMHEDLRRVQSVREAIGPNIDLMVDANGRWLLPDAFDFCSRVADFHLIWLEEPIWYDDVEGHRQLASRCGVPIALGEQLYTVDHFKQFLAAGAVDFVQPDAVRLAGITEWLMVAHLAFAYRLPVVPHILAIWPKCICTLP